MGLADMGEKGAFGFKNGTTGGRGSIGGKNGDITNPREWGEGVLDLLGLGAVK